MRQSLRRGPLGIVAFSVFVTAQAVPAQETTPAATPVATATGQPGPDAGSDPDPAGEPPAPGFWARFGGTTPLGLSARSSGEAGFWARTAEGMGRVWSEGRPTLIVSGYAWHLPWKHKTERQKAFNDAAWGGGFGRSFAENDRRRRLFYALVNNDSYDHAEIISGYAWLARWRPAGALRLGAGYTMCMIGRSEYYYVPLPLMLPVFTAGTDSAELFATYVPYGEVILLVGRFTF